MSTDNPERFVDISELLVGQSLISPGSDPGAVIRIYREEETPLGAGYSIASTGDVLIYDGISYPSSEREIFVPDTRSGELPDFIREAFEAKLYQIAMVWCKLGQGEHSPPLCNYTSSLAIWY